MGSTTHRLNLYQPNVDDQVEETIISLANNFKVIDDNYDETISNISTFLTVGKVYDSGKKFWNRIPNIGGFSGWINIRTGVFAPVWKKQTTYTIGDKIISETNNGHYYECISSGTSGEIQPSFPTVADATVHDLYGHSVWQASYNYSLNDIIVSTVGDKSTYYKCVLAGTSGNVEPSWNNIAGSTNLDGGVEWYVYKTAIWKEMGISCEFISFGNVGQFKGANTIDTVGTITSGIWKGNEIEVEYGGTGATNANDARSNLGATGKYAVVIGDGTKRTFTINHDLGSRDVVVVVRESGLQGQHIDPDVIKVPDSNNIIVEFNTAPTANQYKVIVIG